MAVHDMMADYGIREGEYFGWSVTGKASEKRTLYA